MNRLFLPARAKLHEQVRHLINIVCCFSDSQLPFSELGHNVLVGHWSSRCLLVVFLPAFPVLPYTAQCSASRFDLLQDCDDFIPVQLGELGPELTALFAVLFVAVDGCIRIGLSLKNWPTSVPVVIETKINFPPLVAMLCYYSLFRLHTAPF